MTDLPRSSCFDLLTTSRSSLYSPFRPASLRLLRRYRPSLIAPKRCPVSYANITVVSSTRFFADNMDE